MEEIRDLVEHSSMEEEEKVHAFTCFECKTGTREVSRWRSVAVHLPCIGLVFVQDDSASFLPIL